MSEDNQTLIVDVDIKKEQAEEEEQASDDEDLRSLDRSFENEVDETSSNKNGSIDKDLSENVKSDDDMQG